MPPLPSPKQHHTPQKQGHQLRPRTKAVAGDFKFQDEENKGQKDQQDADNIDGQGLEGEKGQEQADGADDPGEHHPRVGDLEIEPRQADHHQDKGDVGVGDVLQHPETQAFGNFPDRHPGGVEDQLACLPLPPCGR